MITFQPMQEKASAFACGKLILSGEHAVVYGHPAIAIPVSRGVRVDLERVEGDTHMPEADEILHRALLTILPPKGLKVQMHSSLPLGRGMGSSAALAVACLRALSQMCHEEISFESTFARAFAMERIFHGSPSGVDHAVSASGKAIFYKKGHDKPQIEPMSIPRLGVVVMDTGIAGDTGRMVSKVRSKMSVNLDTINQIGSVTEAIRKELLQERPAPHLLGELLSENQRLLRDLDVSTQQLDNLCKIACEAGAYGAKLAGAGGGGVAFALVSDPTAVLSAVRGHCEDAFCVSTELEKE